MSTPITQAEAYTKLVPGFFQNDPLDVTQHGAMFLMCFNNAEVTDAIGEDVSGPDNWVMELCTTTAYQFPDGSLVWIIDAPESKYACLLGYYNGQYIQGAFVKPLVPYNDN